MSGAAPRGENTVGLAVTWNPPSGLADRVGRLREQLGGFVVVDNGSSGRGAERVDALEADHDVRVERLGENRGVAAAINRGLALALEDGFDWALLLDQDTRPHPGLLERLRAVYGACPFRDRVAVVGVNYRNPDTGRLDRPEPGEGPWAEVATVITAGSLLRLAAVRELGPFREDFFVDQVDHEYCLRARRAGWRVIASTEPLMDQPVGRATLHPLLWGETATSNHPPERRYYITRNVLLLAREYLTDEPRWVLRNLVGRVRRVVRMLVYEDHRAAKLWAVLRGAADGLRGRTGRAPAGLREDESS